MNSKPCNIVFIFRISSVGIRWGAMGKSFL